MGKPCRVSFLAFRDGLALRYGDGPLDDFSPGNLEDGIAYCHWLMKDFRMTHEPLDGFSLSGYIEWANGYLKSQT